MELKRSSRTLIIILLVGIFVFGLTSCKLPASKGPETANPTSEGFPIPGETQPASSGGTVNTSATQTAQAYAPVTIPTNSPPQNTTQVPAYPGSTSLPAGATPTAAPVVYITATPGGPPATYTLAEGEFLFCIARRFNVNQNELLSLNNLTANSFVYAGQVLQIPQTGNPFDGTRTLQEHPTTYKILEGDTLNTIACYFGDVSPDMIALQNNLKTTDLPPGEVLYIP
jgi:LysM repeat protein